MLTLLFAVLLLFICDKIGPCIAQHDDLDNFNNCNIFYHPDDVLLSRDNKMLTNIKLTNYFEIEFDININTLCDNLNGDWGYDSLCNILQIGDNDLKQRYPAVFIVNYENNNFWTTRLTTDDGSECCGDKMDLIEPELTVGRHHVYMAITHYSFSITIDNKTTKQRFSHRIIPTNSYSLYFGNPWYRSVDGMVNNICIRSSETELYRDLHLILQLKDIESELFPISLYEYNGIWNEDNKSKNAYSIIGSLNKEKYLRHNIDNKYQFQLINKNIDDTIDILIWKQSSWITDSNITGYEIISIPQQSQVWQYEIFQGLCLTTMYGINKTYLSSPSNYFANAVGPMIRFNGGFPGFKSKIGVSQSLYIYSNNVNISKISSSGNNNPNYDGYKNTITYLIVFVVLLFIIIIIFIIYLYWNYVKNKKEINNMKNEIYILKNNNIQHGSVVVVDGANQCIICVERRATMFNYPCGHVTYCSICSENAVITNNKCPMCRQPIRECKNIYSAGFTA